MADLRFHNTVAGKSTPAKVAGSPGSRKESIWNREIELTPSFGSREKAHFFQMLGVLMESGLSISESLETLEDQTKKRRHRQILGDIRRGVSEGLSLYEAVSPLEKYFTQFEIHSLRMGEASGKMVQVFHNLADYHQRRLRLRRKLSQASVYPAAVLLIAAAVMSVMLVFVVPMFEEVFSQSGNELPAVTRMVLNMSRFLQAKGIWLLLALLTGVFLLYRFRESPAVARPLSRLVMKIPVIGKLIFTVQLSRFCYTFALMLRSKVNLDQSLELLEKIITYPPVQATLAQVRRDITTGRTLHEAFSRHKIYPLLMLQMIRVGERTARLDTMMENLGKNLEEESETRIGSFTALLEPFLIVFLGLIVATILLAMYLPMFQMSKNF